MNRRGSIRTLLAGAAGLITLPAWANNWTLNDVVQGTVSSWRPEDQVILSAVADTIIPAGESVGALSVGVDKYLMKLIGSCYDVEVQANVKKQMEALEGEAMKRHQKSFGACDQPAREAMLMSLGNSSIAEEKDFFDLMKSETIRGFSTSREVMMGYLKYKPAPGHYHGCVDVTT